MTTVLTRKQAHVALSAAGWNPALFDMMTAIGAAESSLRVEVTGPKNSDGSEDYGWLQINSRYVTGDPYFVKSRLLSEPTYNARAALYLYQRQGLKAWAAYNNNRHLPYLPPDNGGPALKRGAAAWFLVKELQEALNAAGAYPALVPDGAFGPKTEEALAAYQSSHRIEPNMAGPVYWNLLVPE